MTLSSVTIFSRADMATSFLAMIAQSGYAEQTGAKEQAE
jgi:hypothetical protein